jgi:acyl-CoA synthetase (AMP-forming)/AMP-acid ligase II
VQGWAGTSEVWNTYGLTETGSWVAGTSVGEFEPADGLIGPPWGATLHVTRPTAGGACAPGEVGRVWIESPALMRGYLGQDGLTRRAIVDGRFATGDLGLLDERGWLHLRGRERDEINKGGMKISPAEVDAAAEGCPGVAEVCAFALDDPLYGQNVGLAVALTGAGDVAVRDLYRWMRERLAEAKLPARWWLVEAIPRSARGKVSRDEVRDACAGRPALDLTRILQGR